MAGNRRRSQRLVQRLRALARLVYPQWHTAKDQKLERSGCLRNRWKRSRPSQSPPPNWSGRAGDCGRITAIPNRIRPTCWVAETVGYKLADEYVDNIQLSPRQIQEVAKKYLIEDHLTIAELDPQPIDPNKPKNEPRFVR